MNTDTTRQATLYRMVMPDHLYPFGLKSKHLFAVNHAHLKSSHGPKFFLPYFRSVFMAARWAPFHTQSIMFGPTRSVRLYVEL